MIGWEEMYKVVCAMAPLYVALGLGYGSVRWWHMFKPDHCDAINRFNCYFVMPFFGFEFTSHFNPYTMNYKFLLSDVIAKCIVGIVLAFWANFSSHGNLSWSITIFSLSSLNNTLVVGVPLLKAMYGQLGADLVVQSSVIQALLWILSVIFMLELSRVRFMMNDATLLMNSAHHEIHGNHQDSSYSSVHNNNESPIEMENMSRGDGGDFDVEQNGRRGELLPPLPPAPRTTTITTTAAGGGGGGGVSFWSIMKTVLVKLIQNPNAYATLLGLIWALLSFKWHFEMPEIIEGSIVIMSRGGSAVAMFNLGLFMGLQGKIMSCGIRKTILGMILRFIIGPATLAIGALLLGLRGKVLCITIVQGALPQAVASFVYAQEYGLHADVLSTAVILGTIVSLPLLIGYFAILDVLP